MTNNTVYNSNSENGAIYMVCDGTTGIIIEGNEVRDNAAVGILIDDETSGGPDPNGITINNNCIERNTVGAESNITGTINAQSNWWGDPNPPVPGVDFVGGLDVANHLTVRPACGAPPITPADRPCEFCEEFQCGIKSLDMRQVCSRSKKSLFGFWLQRRAKKRCVFGKNVETLFELDPKAVCGDCP